MLEEHAQLEEVRSGRSLFVRKLRLGKTLHSSSSTGTTTYSTSLQLVCCHGTCASEQQYHPLLESIHQLLVEEHTEFKQLSIQCLLFDLVGCGQSPALPDRNAYSNAAIMADLQALLCTHVNPNVPLVVMGHSYACNVILPMLQQSKPLHLAGCVFLSSAVRCSQNPNPNGGHPIMKLPVVLLKCLQSQLTNAFVQKGVHPDHTALCASVRQASNTNNMVVAKFYYHHHDWADLDTVRQVAANTSANSKLKKTASFLVLHGASDGIIPVEAGQALANALSTELVLVDNVSHLIMLERPRAVAELVWNFLEPLCQK